jgi:TonB family protein
MFTHQTQIPRSPLASTMTVVFHVSLGIAVIAVSALPNIPKIVEHERLTFVVAAPLPPNLAFELPPPPKPVPPPPRLEPKPVLDPPKAMEAPAIVKPTPPPPAPEKRPEPPKAAEPLPPVPVPKPQVMVGAFADAATAVRKPEPKLDVAAAGFESATEQQARTRREVAVVQGFDTNLPATAKPERTALVADSGFGSAAATTTARQAPRELGVGGFGADPTPRPAPQRAAPRETGVGGFGSDPTPRPAPQRAAPVAQPATFADAPPPPPRPVQAAPRPQADRPVEVVYKPSPAYTDEARAQRVEGEVVLEVEFTADGKVRVLRVVRGLGFGLDDMARRATEQIRFRPATSKGVPVDFRANLTIVFRLT